eukprot:gene13743-biopygen5049
MNTKGTRFGERSAGLAPQRALQPFFNGFGGFFAGSAERGWCRRQGAEGRLREPRAGLGGRDAGCGGRWGVGGQAARRWVAAGGVRFFANSAVARSFRTLLASSRRDTNRTRRAQSVAR